MGMIAYAMARLRRPERATLTLLADNAKLKIPVEDLSDDLVHRLLNTSLNEAWTDAEQEARVKHPSSAKLPWCYRWVSTYDSWVCCECDRVVTDRYAHMLKHLGHHDW